MGKLYDDTYMKKEGAFLLKYIYIYMSHDFGDEKTTDSDEIEANACVMAASKDLLQACRAMLEEYNADGLENNQAVLLALDAIIKASPY